MHHRFWLIRHALVHPDALNYLYGTNDVAICSTTMAADAHRYAALAARLPRPARLIVTPLSRTHFTARALFAAGYPETPWEVEPAFVEQNFGDWQGVPIGEFANRPAAERHPFWPIAAAEIPPGGESFAEMVERVGTSLEHLTHSEARDIIIISHGGAIRAACAHALKLTPHQALSLAVENISLTRLEYNGSDWRLVVLNEQIATCV
ncbi:MAG: histidine phosphatase family protein [Acidocella sp. 20-57-95]|nr:MAG: histidine phosphatase family protein [Acidocella sp. 20-57-95]OYV61985.1 MAG: histidine phosphatase family protein [Acidocella sp. 21-58-7]HQT65337.1 histidine phosphatase family protein [Acidocella sp.]HQU03982.1 histidine phosphatase family protein [Acidocella sp.]